MYETRTEVVKPLEFPLITRYYDDAPFMRNVTFFRVGKYSAEHSLI
jgi:hypothetical protein